MSGTGPDDSAGSRNPSSAPGASTDGTESAADRTGAFDPQPAGHEVVGTVIAGKYTLLELIGEGGMGSVWKAQQSEPVKRLVAVKLIKGGTDSRQVVARFEAERQALAVMDHPNIAKILDGGMTGEPGSLSAGVPYFVMELVVGESITKYCDARRLMPRQRLELFVPVCQAIQHAHQKGIIHRDIKPSNVMVALYDEKPVPKVIDFGVAKATGGQFADEHAFTGIGNIVGTAEYMSPEQAGLDNVDVDTRSDIYSLGVLLYELLAGSPPFKRKELERAGMLEILRVIREEEPPRPSTKLSTADALPSLSANRGMEPKRLTGLLRNELDWIVMKALEKDRGRRYETANGFAADVGRYLIGEPVTAHPPSAGYRLRKFARRHKGQVIAAAAVAAAVTADVVAVITVQVRANYDLAAKNYALAREQEKTEAERVKAADNAATAIQVVHDLSRYVSMIELSGGQAITDQQRKTTLDAALVSYERLLALHPDDADVRASVARTHRYRANLCRLMNLTGDAERSYREASRHYAALAAAHPDVPSHRKDVALTSRDFALFLKTLGRLKKATNILDGSTGVYEELVRDGPDRVADQRPLAMMLLDRAEIDYLLGDYIATERRARRSADLYARLAETTGARVEPLDPLFRGMAEIRLAMALRELDRVDDSLAVHDRAAERLGGVARLSSSREYLNESYRAQAERAWTLARLPARRAAALDALNTAVDGYKKLAEQFPQVPAYLRSQGSATLYRGRLKALLGERDAAAQDLAAASRRAWSASTRTSPFIAAFWARPTRPSANSPPTRFKRPSGIARPARCSTGR